MHTHQARIFLEQFDCNRNLLCWDELTKGINALFYSELGEHKNRIPEILEYMTLYDKEMGI